MLGNWAGNVEFAAFEVHYPSTLDELRQLVASRGRIRALGTGHSFSRVADTEAELVSVSGLPASVEIDSVRRQARVAAGMRYGEVATQLHAAGFALPNLGSLPHISVAGAVATGTHGSGDGNGNLATSVSTLELVVGSGDLVELSREIDGDRFRGAVVALGGLGVTTSLTLDLVPTFEVAQRVYEDVPRERMLDALGSGYSVSLFTDWSGPEFTQVWVKRLVGNDRPQLAARPASGPRHPVSGMPVEHCTEQLDVPGPWHLRLPHFRLEHTPSSGEELQSEFFVAREHVEAALAELDAMRSRIHDLVQVSEIRSIAGDQLWMSPAHGRDTVAIHFTWRQDVEAVAAILPELEARLATWHARPHWGKLFTHGAEQIASLYPRHGDFVDLLRVFDPSGRFRNGFINEFF